MTNVSNLLPWHPRRLNDEILSSWILRIAAGNNVSARSLCAWLGNDQPVAALDRMAHTSPLIASIAQAIGVEKEQVIECLPSSLHGLSRTRIYRPRRESPMTAGRRKQIVEEGCPNPRCEIFFGVLARLLYVMCRPSALAEDLRSEMRAAPERGVGASSFTPIGESKFRLCRQYCLISATAHLVRLIPSTGIQLSEEHEFIPEEFRILCKKWCSRQLRFSVGC
jgi:hypothetical protein